MEWVGYSWLIEHFSLPVLDLCQAGQLSSGREVVLLGLSERTAVTFPSRLRPEPTWQGHLLFALKHEGPNLAVLKALFGRVGETAMTELVRQAPYSVYVRRLWFLYEYLMGVELPLQPLRSGNYDLVLPPEEFLCLSAERSWRARRQRLLCNLPGDAVYCPLVRLSPVIRKWLQRNLEREVHERLAEWPAELLCRAGDYLYRKETKASYAIERQTPSQRRAVAFMAVLSEAGRGCLDKRRLVSLQNCIVEERYAEQDYRTEQVYVGQTLAPGREHIHFVGLRPQDVPTFMEHYLETFARLVEDRTCDTIILAAVLSFSLVFFHPFNDGNGRLHRYLMHHILALRGFSPEQVIFPVSAILLKRPQLYDSMLESFSRRLMPMLNYRLDANGVMTVLTDSADFYRYLDFTPIVETFFAVVEETLHQELLPELGYLRSWERIRARMRDVVDMPERQVRQFILFTQQNRGHFPKGRRSSFPELSDEEVETLADIIREELFGASLNS